MHQHRQIPVFQTNPVSSRQNIAFIGLLAGTFCFGLLAPSLYPGGHASAETHETIRHRTSFSVSLGIMPLGTADFDYFINNGSYSIKGAGKTGGLVDVFTSGYGNFSSTGRVSKNQIKVGEHQAEVRERKKKGILKMSFDNNGVKTVYQKPDKRKKRMNPEKYIVVQPGHLKHVVDPASAIIIAVDEKDIFNGQEVCNRTVPVYDGETRYNMKLSYKRTSEVTTNGYFGLAVTFQ